MSETCNRCGGLLPRDPEGHDEHLVDPETGDCPGYTVAEVLGCGAWRAEVYEEGDAADRAAIEEILAAYVHAPAEHRRDDGTYLVGWTTRYDDLGDFLLEDPVEEIRVRLPAGWRVEWTGDGNGDEEDFVIERVS